MGLEREDGHLSVEIFQQKGFPAEGEKKNKTRTRRKIAFRTTGIVVALCQGERGVWWQVAKKQGETRGRIQRKSRLRMGFCQTEIVQKNGELLGIQCEKSVAKNVVIPWRWR